jgi:EPS-associated MarR family transcriptional regulator
MNKLQNSEENLQILRKIEKKPKHSQRKLAKELKFSLGKLNYCLKALNQKGLIKINNFQENKNKINYFYALTPKGINYRISLTIKFMNKKMKEYDDLKKEI